MTVKKAAKRGRAVETRTQVLRLQVEARGALDYIRENVPSFSLSRMVSEWIIRHAQTMGCPLGKTPKREVIKKTVDNPKKRE